jgi:hypothetical protein
MARAILSGLQHAKLLPSHLTKDSIKLSIRSDGSYRLFLDNVDSQQSQYFVKCVKELLAPVRNQPYLIPKYEYVFPEPRNKGAEKNSKRKLLKVAQTNIDGLAPESESVVSADATSISAEASSSEFNADPKATDRIPDPTVPMINADPGLASANPQAPTITANDTSGVASASESAPDEETMGFPLSRKAKLLPKTFKSSTNVSAIDLFAKSFGKDRFVTAEAEESEDRFFKAYLKGRAEPRIAAYYPVPSLLARSEKGRAAFESAWNKYVSPGFIVATEDNPELLNRYFGMGASLAQRLLWE